MFTQVLFSEISHEVHRLFLNVRDGVKSLKRARSHHKGSGCGDSELQPVTAFKRGATFHPSRGCFFLEASLCARALLGTRAAQCTKHTHPVLTSSALFGGDSEETSAMQHLTWSGQRTRRKHRVELGSEEGGGLGLK